MNGDEYYTVSTHLRWASFRYHSVF